MPRTNNNKSQAIREAHSLLGSDATLADIRAHLKAKGIDTTSQQVSNAINYAPTNDSLKNLMKIAQKLGGLNRLRRLIDYLIKLEPGKKPLHEDK